MLPDFLQKLGGPRRIMIGAVGLIVAGVILVISRVATEPNWVPAVTGVPLQSASELTDRLDQAAIKYKLDRGGAEILVAQADLARARVTLAKDGLPGGNRPGLEIFDRPSWGWNDFTQRVNYRRALEGELERTIGRMRGIERAEVHIAISDQGGFRAANERPATASVLIALKDAGLPGQDIVQGIAHLVSSSVDGLSAENVSIHDETGKQWSDPSDGSSAGLTSRQLRVQQDVEKYLEHKASDLVTQVVGPGNSRVQVAAAINFDKVERTTLSVDPEKQALAQEIKAEIVPGAQGGAGSTNVNSSYENTKSTEVFSGAIGNIRRMTVAVLVADAPVPSTGPTDTIPRYTPRPPEELARLETLVRSALGADSSRGDAVSVVSLPMPVQRVKPSVPVVPTFAEKMQPYERPALTVIGLLLAFGMGMMALRSLRTPPVKAASATLTLAPAEPAPALVRAAPPRSADLPSYSFPIADTQIRDRVVQTVDENPDAAARLVKSWLKDS